ncbi:signal peptidase I [Streptomyces avicenniae]|uniref:signal peptidase I n=1 Tax=Streptomyces avicenniae TaxID=500153 RepID=UPI0006993680|nr:signal peptidase I [Streptomyces avicenniae]
MRGAAGGAGRRERLVSGVAVAVGCVLFLGGFVLGALLYQPYTVPTGSMAPSVAAGDRVLAQRIDGDDVRRGDVVVFRDETWGDIPMLKRVVGVGGDQVACCDGEGRLLINGEPVTESYVRSDHGASATAFDVTVPEDELFVLGDDRMDSLDSRSHITATQAGSVPRAAVDGRVEATVWPPGRFGGLPRASGFAELPGGISGQGPLWPLVWAVGGGAVLIFAGAAYGRFARGASRTGLRRRAGAAGGAQ